MANLFPSLWGEYSLSFITLLFYMTSVTYKGSDLENRVLEKVSVDIPCKDQKVMER